MRKATCTWYPVCPMKRFYEAGRLEERFVKNYCMGDFHSCVRYQKEEAGIYHPDNMLPDGTIDENLS